MYQQDGFGTLVDSAGEIPKTFLSSCIPNLQFDAVPIDIHSLDFEVYSNGGDVGLAVGRADITEEQVGFAHCRVSNYSHLGHAVIIFLHRLLSFTWESKSIMPKSTSAQDLPSLLLFLLLPLAFAQSDCVARAFPAIVPMALNESLVIDLYDYFQGSNLTFAVTPNNDESSIDNRYECKEKASVAAGGVVASHMTSAYGVEIQGNLLRSSTNFYILAYLQTSTYKVTNLRLPILNKANCSDFVLTLPNSTYLSLVVTCIEPQDHMAVLISAEALLDFKDPIWEVKRNKIWAAQTEGSWLAITGQALLRSVGSVSNSYVEVWSWGQSKELVGLLDRTFLGIAAFRLKSMRAYDDIILLLDFYSGIHVVKVNGQLKSELVGSLWEPFYELFEFVPSSGALWLGKKGKVVSAKVTSLKHGNILVGSSYSLFAYQPVRQIVAHQNNLLVLGESYINLFALSYDPGSYFHYSTFAAKDAAGLFRLDRPNQPLSVLVPDSQQGLTRYYVCTVRSPLLRLRPSSEVREIKVMGYSVVGGQTSICRQIFNLAPQGQEKDIIYDNGYKVGEEVLFANLPGKGEIKLGKYGAGRKLNYQVIKDSNSKIDYLVEVRKEQQQGCSLQNRVLGRGGSIYRLSTWQNLMLVQLSSDWSLRYFYCQLANSTACSYALEMPFPGALEQVAYQLIDQTDAYSISFEALLQNSNSDLTVQVRKLLVRQEDHQLQASFYCSIKVTNFASEFANITQLTIAEGRLFLLMPLRKEVRIYSLTDNSCPLLLSLTPSSFPGTYFAPRSLHVDLQSPHLLFLRQWDQLVSLRLEGSPLKATLLGANILPDSLGGSLVISRPFVLYMSSESNRTWLYRFDDGQQLQYLRELDLEGRQLLPFQVGGEDYFQVLDKTHIALSLFDQKSGVKSIKVFSIEELISVASEYLDVQLTSNDQAIAFFSYGLMSSKQLMLLQLIPGPSTSFLVCRSSQIDLSPSAIFTFVSTRTSSATYSENVTIKLFTASDQISHDFAISLSNLGQGISRGKRFPSRGTAVDAAAELVLDDSFWFSGTVYDYEFDCRNCNDRIKFSSKVSLESQEELPFSSSKFFISNKENRIQAVEHNFLVELKKGLHPWPLEAPDSPYALSHISVLSAAGQDCVDTVAVEEKNVRISLCWVSTTEGQENYILSLISTVSSTGFIVAEVRMQFPQGSTVKLAYQHEIVVVYGQEIALLFTAWNIDGILELVELDRIDREDISGDICALEIISNETSSHDQLTSLLYGLVITQCTSELYYSSFSVYLEQEKDSSFSVPNIHISYSQNIDLPKIWSQRRIQVPSDASVVQTITRSRTSFLQDEVVLGLVVVFDRFHSFQFKLTASKVNRIIKSISLESVYYKFGANTAVSAQLQKYFVVKYVVDAGYGKMQELYGCFDLDQYLLGKDNLGEHYTFVSHVFKRFQGHQAHEDYPWVLQNSRIYHIVEGELEVLFLNNSLTATISGLNDTDGEQLFTQNIIVTANNPISARSASIILQAKDEIILSALAIGLIVVGGLLLLTGLLFAIRAAVRKIAQRLKLVELEEHHEAEDAELEGEEEERAQWLINMSERGSVEP